MNNCLYISTGLLYSSTQFLQYIDKGISIKRESIISQFPHDICSPQLVVSFIEACGWIENTSEGNVKVSPRGKYLVEIKDTTKLLRGLLFDYIKNTNPFWQSMITNGRTSIRLFMDIDTRQCFQEALLFDNIDDETIKWWDTIASARYDEANHKKLEIGRIGERLTLEYERKRIGEKAKWFSIEDNNAGYDILSLVEGDSNKQLCIEVKTSIQGIGNASAYISRYEWDTAVSSENYVFHFWSIEKTPYLAIISKDQMQKHIPINTGDGKWENAKIPYSSFRGLFVSNK